MTLVVVAWVELEEFLDDLPLLAEVVEIRAR